MKCNKLKAKLKAVKRRILLPLFVSGFSNFSEIISKLSGQQIRLWSLEAVEPGLAAQAVLKSQVLHFFGSDRRPHRGPTSEHRWPLKFLGNNYLVAPISPAWSHRRGEFFARMVTGIATLVTSFLCLSVSSVRVEEQWPDLKLVINSNKLYQILGDWRS